jgi:thiol-disulfide isomerase/thioredoxin
MKRFIFSLCLSAGLLVLQTSHGEERPLDFSLARLGGGELSLSDLRGQWVALNYWATWCGPCRKEIPDLSALHDRNPSVTVLGLAYEETSEEEFLAFLEEYPASYPILLVDVMNPPEPFGAPRVLPTTILIDPQGSESRTWVGPVTSEQIETAIEEAGEKLQEPAADS